MPVEAVFDPQVEIAQISQVIPNPLEKPVFTHLIPALQKNKLGWPSWLHSFQYRDIVPNEADVKHFAINTKIEDVPIRIERELVPNGSGNFVLVERIYKPNDPDEVFFGIPPYGVSKLRIVQQGGFENVSTDPIPAQVCVLLKGTNKRWQQKWLKVVQDYRGNNEPNEIDSPFRMSYWLKDTSKMDPQSYLKTQTSLEAELKNTEKTTYG